jgi:hypothetical protein
MTDLGIRILEAQKHTDPTDPDPQHCQHPSLGLEMILTLFVTFVFFLGLYVQYSETRFHVSMDRILSVYGADTIAEVMLLISPFLR